MTPTPDEVAALIKRLRDILKFDDDLTEDDKLRLEAADALDSLSPPAGIVKDAERYRWLRSKVGTEVGQGDVLVYIIDREQVFQEPLRAQIDAAIDAAMLSARERKD